MPAIWPKKPSAVAVISPEVSRLRLVGVAEGVRGWPGSNVAVGKGVLVLVVM